MKLSKLVQVATAVTPFELRALELAEYHATVMVGTTGLMWLEEEGGDGDHEVPFAAEQLAEEIEAEARPEDYTKAREALERLARHSPTGKRVSEATATLLEYEARASYYLGLARGWHAAQRLARNAHLIDRSEERGLAVSDIVSDTKT